MGITTSFRSRYYEYSLDNNGHICDQDSDDSEASYSYDQSPAYGEEFDHVDAQKIMEGKEHKLQVDEVEFESTAHSGGVVEESKGGGIENDGRHKLMSREEEDQRELYFCNCLKFVGVFWIPEWWKGSFRLEKLIGLFNFKQLDSIGAYVNAFKVDNI
ncbi:unnamed protein product [Moneuplotes crassus]|uniref:Uncharacterized protein n=1 Tax=Euplotes crassus TaxID=5936 RepID=A0AAD1X633_EUPCR|nr:unnamed protein product [Moneuplotes crassus]